MCSRADTVIALQDQDARLFRRLAGKDADVRVISPIAKGRRAAEGGQVRSSRLGDLGSSNWVNGQNLVEFIKGWVKSDALLKGAELVLGGGICRTLANFAPRQLIDRAVPRYIGSIDRLQEFFDSCDIFVNPERGGTGIKIKTLDAMAHGVPVLSTSAGFVGIESQSRFHAACNTGELIRLVEELALDPCRVQEVAKATAAAQATYFKRHRQEMANLLGPVVGKRRFRPRDTGSVRPATESPIVPDYVRDNASSYHFEEFERLWRSTEIQGKRVLEVGSDYHLISARLFQANGAAEVVATNLGDWTSDAPLPEGVKVLVGDVADLADTVLDLASFDIIYGVAILEHISDLDRVAAALKRLLKPDC